MGTRRSNKLSLQDIARRYKNQAAGPAVPDQMGPNKITATQQMLHDLVNGPGKSASMSYQEPASLAEMMRPAAGAGMPLQYAPTGFKNKDGSEERAPSIDAEQAFASRLTPELEEMLMQARQMPTEIDLTPLNGVAELLSMSDKKYPEFAPSKHTADHKEAKILGLQKMMQEERDNEMERQQKFMNAIAGMQSGRYNMSQAQLNPPQPRVGSERLNRLSDKQVADINAYDATIAQAETLLSRVNGKKSWVGPVDGRIPDMLVGADQNVFRSEIGQMTDRYRSLITGAAAADKELARIEARLPQASDKYEVFVEKTKEFLKAVKASKNRTLRGFGLQGKTVNPEFYSNPESRVDGAPADTGGQKMIKKSARDLLK